MVLYNSIEIGRRLIEAKNMLEHGEWGKWLEKSVDYSQSTANNLMRIFEEYGANQIAFFCDNAKSQALGNLSYTQAVALLGIPREERESFISENDIDSMSTRELQQAIKEKQELKTRLDEVEAGWVKAKNEADNAKRLAEEFREGLDSAKNRISKIAEEKDKLLDSIQKAHDERDKSRKEVNALKSSMAELKKQLSEAQASGNKDEIECLSESLVKTDEELEAAYKKIEELEQQLKEPIEVTAAPVVEKIPEEIQKELAELRKFNSKQINKFTFCFDSLVNGFRDLLNALSEITDLEAQEKYKVAVKGLIEKMSERL